MQTLKNIYSQLEKYKPLGTDSENHIYDALNCIEEAISAEENFDLYEHLQQQKEAAEIARGEWRS